MKFYRRCAAALFIATCLLPVTRAADQLPSAPMQLRYDPSYILKMVARRMKSRYHGGIKRPVNGYALSTSRTPAYRLKTEDRHVVQARSERAAGSSGTDVVLLACHHAHVCRDVTGVFSAAIEWTGQQHKAPFTIIPKLRCSKTCEPDRIRAASRTRDAISIGSNINEKRSGWAAMQE